ncbi:MAG: hydrogenase [Candidatus Aureabacteria bacterium]|nr:hydrogenase [Candidatus Auribacterota bacterium]
MEYLLFSLVLLFVSGLASLFAARNRSLSTAFAVSGILLAAGFGIIPVIRCIFSGTADMYSLPYPIPLGRLMIELNPLSAFFILPTYILAFCSALYSYSYLHGFKEDKSVGAYWFFYQILIASMILVFLAANGIVFLFAWEIMTIASYFLISFQHEKEQTKKAGWIYLIATHFGTCFLLVFFILLNQINPDFNLSPLTDSNVSKIILNCLFIFSWIGFGIKAGMIPFHIWLPEAHPAAPSPVSAVLSGIMIKTGIYGIMKTLVILGNPPVWWGWFLIIIGSVSGILGVLFALAEHDLKKLLAYHSVENIGIITLGLGTGLIGLSEKNILIASLGIGGSLLHIFNHAVFKSLLFLGAGSVYCQTHSLDIDHSGGLMKKMPVTGWTFLIGSIAISGLPPLNGFVSEFLIYLASFTGMASLSPAFIMIFLATILSLALIGGLALTCFTKVFGIMFLGESRTHFAEPVKESPSWMTSPMILLSLFCVLIGLFAPAVFKTLSRPILYITGSSLSSISDWHFIYESLNMLSLSCTVFLVVLFLVILLRRFLLSRQPAPYKETWGCGFLFPSSRMQYTASSFSDPLKKLFQFILRIQKTHAIPESYFPKEASFSTHYNDIFNRFFYQPVFSKFVKITRVFKGFQHGMLQMYVLYIALVLCLLLIWKVK